MNKELVDKFEELVETISDKKLARVCTVLLDDDKFFEWPAAKKHQAYDGGLAEHTWQVIQNALVASSSEFLKVNTDIIKAGALWHDYGKIWDYQRNDIITPDQPKWVYTRHRWSTRHVARSYHEFVATAESLNLDRDLTEEVGHVILAHHGRMEWGSPVEPLTPEAMIVHHADVLSAYYDGKKHMFRDGQTYWKNVDE